MVHLRGLRVLGVVMVAAALAGIAAAGDWPHFRGPNGDGICTEKGLLQEWPADGPPLLWKVTGLGKGFAAVSAVGDKLFTMGDRNGKQFVLALNRADGKELWAAEVGNQWATDSPGPRCTPTVDGDLLYAIGSHGDLVCLEVAGGKERWRKSFARDFGGRMMSGWGFSESPLIDGEKLLCTPGGADALVVALNKETGEVIWKCAASNLGPKGKDGAGYASIVISEACGVRQYVQMTGKGLIGVAAKDGKLLWNYNRVANGTANIANAICKGDYVFGSTSYSTGSVLLKLTAADGGVKAEEVYFLGPDVLQNHHGGLILLGDHVYAGHGRNAGAPVCIEMKTGKVAWKDKAPGGGSAAFLFADGNLYVRYESGLMTLIEATPEAFKLKSSFQLPVKNGPSWPHPVIVDGKLYLRDHDALMCYEVQKH